MRLLVWLVLFFTAFAVYAAPTPYQVDIEKGSVNLVPYVEYNVGQGDPLEAPPIEGWSQFNNDFIKLGYDANVHWFRFSLDNPTPYPLSFYIELDNPLLDNVTFYTLHNGKVRNVQNLGDNYDFALRPVLQESFVIPVSILSGETLEFYLAVQSAGTINFPLTLWQKEHFQQHENYDRLVAGLFIGIIIAAIFAYLVIFILNHTQTALLDALLLTSLLFITVTMNGYAFHYIWPEYPAFQQHAIYLFSCLAMGCSALLARQHVLDVKQQHPLISSFLIVAVLCIALMPLTLYLSYQWALYLITSAAIVLCSFHIYSGFWLWKQGLEEEQDLNLGITVWLAAVIFIAINSFTSAKLPFTNVEILQLAMLIIVTILSVNMIKKHIEREQETTLQINDENIELADDLEKQLAEQNLELQVTLRELEDKNTELEKLNTIDALSGIYNRRHFDKRILAEIRRSRRELSPLSLIMFDIDHFKSVNDKYGHIAGDEVIRTVSQTAKDQLNRSADEVFRYGGEEFAVLLPNTEIEGAKNLAENIRLAIESAQIATSSGEVKCTISLGVTCSGSEHSFSPEQLMEIADSALYKAKNDGRNKVVVKNKEDN